MPLSLASLMSKQLSSFHFLNRTKSRVSLREMKSVRLSSHDRDLVKLDGVDQTDRTTCFGRGTSLAFSRLTQKVEQAWSEVE